jgi:hypothetical protein
MKSTENAEDYLTIPKELNMNTSLGIQLFQSCGTYITDSVDFIYGYSHSIPSEFWVSYFLQHA